MITTIGITLVLIGWLMAAGFDTQNPRWSPFQMLFCIIIQLVLIAFGIYLIAL